MKHKTILIVDDMPDNLLTLEELLKDDYTILQARDGQSGLEAAQTHLPELILLDINMPIMDGLTCADRLKETPQTKDIPIIFITSREKPEDEIEGLQHGAVDYISKPFNGIVLLSRIKTHLRLKQQNDNLRRIINQEMIKISEQDVMLKEMLLSSKSELLSDVSHHWRNPLTVIVMFLEVLMERNKEEACEEYFARIQESAKKVVEPAMELSKNITMFQNMFVPQTENIEWFNIGAQIGKSLELLKPRIAAINTTIHCNLSDPLSFCGVITDFNNIIYQILKNSMDAIEDTQPDNPFVSIEWSDKGEGVEITVSDNGGGVSPEVFENLFEPYVTTRGVASGRGIGLFIAYQITHITFRGEIEWENSERGAVFTVTLFKNASPVFKPNNGKPIRYTP